MIPSASLTDFFLSALRSGWGYIYGRSGQTWTAAAQRAASRPQTVAWGARWIGRPVADCSGLFVSAFRSLGESIYHGSNTIWKSHCVRHGKLQNGLRTDGLPLRPGAAVFLTRDGCRHHIGLYTGLDLDGRGATCVEARGTRFGVVASPLSRFHETAELSAVDYGAPMDPSAFTCPTLSRGDRGPAVFLAQRCLNLTGSRLTEDGIFGQKTQSAVLRFQRDHALTPDGILGPKTWSALQTLIPSFDPPSALAQMNIL